MLICFLFWGLQFFNVIPISVVQSICQYFFDSKSVCTLEYLMKEELEQTEGEEFFKT